MANENGKVAVGVKTGVAKKIENLNDLADVFGLSLPGNHTDILTTVEFSKEHSRIIIPEGMDKRTAARDLMNQWDNEEQIQDFTTTLEGWDWKDGLHAFREVMEAKFGWIKGHHSFFSTPTEIDIVTNVVNGMKKTEKAFFGEVTIPAYEDAKGAVDVNKQGQVTVFIHAKRKFSAKISEFFADIRKYLDEKSIYRGKAVTVTVGPKGGLNLEIMEMIPNNRIVLNDDTEMVINNFVLDQLGEAGKRCFLFTGDYGNAKTETAMRVGIAAVSLGSSFFYIKDAALFSHVLGFAKNYEPAVVFLEDIDEIAGSENRDDKMNNILNTLDGVQTKGRNMLVILTTNHPKRINKALRRPGRIDLIVNFANPNERAIEKIYRTYFDKITGGDEIDYEIVVPKTASLKIQGAVVAEICKRAAKLSQKRGSVDTEMILASITSMETQIEFMQEDIEKKDILKEAHNTVHEDIATRTAVKVSLT